MNYNFKDKVDLFRLVEYGPYHLMMFDFLEKHFKNLPPRPINNFTKEGLLENNKLLRSLLLKSLDLSTLPGKKSLDVKMTGKIEKEDYVIEKMVLEVWPKMPISAHLYVPKYIQFPAPAILHSMGHWMENSKMDPDNQSAAIGFVKLGFVVMIYDHADQGERMVEWGGHSNLGTLLIGKSMEGFFVWESIRCIDYLQSRIEVNPDKIGMTGASGGALNLLYTCAVDNRIKVMVPVCYVSTFSNLFGISKGIGWAGGVDLCNSVPNILSYADMSDIIQITFPTPVMIINAIQDTVTSIEGARKAYERLKPIYDKFGKDLIRFVEVDGGHGYSKKMREAAYGWFNKWLKDEGDGSPIQEPKIDIAPPKYRLDYITDTADYYKQSVLNENYDDNFECIRDKKSIIPSNAAISMLNIKQAENLPPKFKIPKNNKEWDKIKKNYREKLFNLLGIFPDIHQPLNSMVLVQEKFDNFLVEKITFESEPGIVIPCLLIQPYQLKKPNKAVIYIDSFGIRGGLYGNSWIEYLISCGLTVFAIDLRGTGQTVCSEFEIFSISQMIGRSLFAQRVFDILRAVEYLSLRSVLSVQIDKHSICCFGDSWAAVVALFATALDDRIRGLIINESLDSYKSLLINDHIYPCSIFIFDILNHLDLPQISSLVANRPLFISNLLDGKRKQSHQTEKLYKVCMDTYNALDVDKGVFTQVLGNVDSIKKDLSKWIDNFIKI